MAFFFLANISAMSFWDKEKMKSIKNGFAKFGIYNVLPSVQCQFSAWLDRRYILFLTPGTC